MSKQNNLTDFLTDVANAIRAKKGSTDLINPQNFSAEIAALSGGLEVIEMTETTATIEPNKVYVWGMVESLDITLGASTDESDFFAFRFRCSKPTMTVVTVNGATWAEDTELDAQGKPVLDLGSWYQCEIKGGTSALYARLAHYIHFADSNVEAVLMSKGIGDGLGITYKDAAKVTSISTWFKSNANITSFDEFKYFTKIKKMQEAEFTRCSSLKKIQLPPELSSMGGSIFSECSALKTISFPETLTYVDGYCFEKCTSLETIHLNEGLKILKNSVFANCTSLKELILPTGLTSIGTSLCQNCKALTKIVIPSTLANINNFMCYSCYNLTDVTINSGVNRIANSAFRDCKSLKSIVLPDTLTNIDQYAFSGDSALVDLEIHAVAPPSLVWNSLPSNLVNIYVPDESVEAYKTATTWSSSASKIKGISEKPS